MAETLTGRVVTGASWSAVSQVATQASTFAIGIVLARLLGPESYGLIGMVSVVTGFAGLFGDLGLGAAIIQRKDLQPRHLNAAFWVNVAMGIAMTAVIASLAPVVAWFFKEPQLMSLTMVVALRFTISSLCVVQIALINRKIKFRTLAKIQIVGTVVAGLVGLGLAFMGMGPWSLVLQSLTSAVMTLALSWSYGSWRPSFSFDRAACLELFGFSGYVLGFNIVNYLARNIDNLLIGRFLGPLALGVYSRGYDLMLLPLTQVAQVVGRVMYPALSEIQGDKVRVKRAYLRIISIIALICFPMMLGLFATSEDFILGLLGEKWGPTIPIVNILCWVGVLQSISTTTGLVFLSQGKTRLCFIIGLTSSAMFVAAFFIGINWGLTGVVWSYVIANLIEWFPVWHFAGKLIAVSFWDMLKAVYPPFLCALTMGLAVRFESVLLPRGMTHWQYLLVEVVSGVVLYAAQIYVFRLNAWLDCKSLFGDSWIGRLPMLRTANRFS